MAFAETNPDEDFDDVIPHEVYVARCSSVAIIKLFAIVICKVRSIPVYSLDDTTVPDSAVCPIHQLDGMCVILCNTH